MFDKIIDIIKAFFEKYFIQALIAIIPTILIYYFTPDNFSFLTKIGKELYLIFFYVLNFLIILFLIFLFKAIKNKLYSVKKEKQYSKDKEYENIKDLWNYIDSLEAMDKKIVEHFIKNNNSPIYLYDNSYIKVLHELCNSSQIISDGTQKFFNIVDGKEEHYIDKGVHIYRFKLNEDAYNLLNYSLKKYKKISNFS